MRPLTFALTLLAGTSVLAAPPVKTKELVDKGMASFAANCAPCHGPTGAGDGPAAVALNPKPRNLASEPLKNGDTVENLFKTVSEGLPGTQMVAFGHLAEADRWAIAYYVKSLRPAEKAAPAEKAGKKGPTKKDAKK